jgi:transketolase
MIRESSDQSWLELGQVVTDPGASNMPSTSQIADPELKPIDFTAIAYARALAADAVQKVGNGHPGTAMALAPVAYLLFQRHLRHDPADPKWLGRDRFILSCGHASLILYTQLYLSGYGLELADLKSFRTWGSLTPGHPEFGHTVGVETTTGPLGQGIANGVGMAMAGRYLHGLLDEKTPYGGGLFDYRVWVLVSDGDLQEGVSGEASSLAGTQALGNLVAIYDDNRISIEGDTHLSFTEDVSARYLAYGWHVQNVEKLPNGDVDLKQLDLAMVKAKLTTDRPSLIHLHSVIAWPAPHAQGTAKAHGSALGESEVAATKSTLGLDPTLSFQMPEHVLAHARKVKTRGAELHATWRTRFTMWQGANPESKALLERLTSQQIPAGLGEILPVFEGGKSVSTREASGQVIQAIAALMPEFWGGSADLAGSNNTTIEGVTSFLPASSEIKNSDPYGRVIHFGIREHAMGSILNGIALAGLSRPFGGTFLVFSDYMRPAVRLAALMQLPVTFVWTHDSIGLGEDGPTHQPVEQLTALRAIPGFDVVRPADGNEVAVCWLRILERRRPAGLVLSRQNLPVFDRSTFASAQGAARGAYTLIDASDANPKAIIIATGSEVGIAVDARAELERLGIPTRVVSAPSLEWFADEPLEYRESILPPKVKARVSIEAGIALSWRGIVGDSGRCVSLEHFGASASAERLYTEFGITSQAVVAAVHESLAS